LRSARVSRGADFETIARRTGIREPLLAAMEAGRWKDLPHGLYARAAVRSYAAFLGLDVAGILTACEAELPGIEDPIAGLARVRGLKPHVEPEAPPPTPPAAASTAAAEVPWRAAAAATLDSVIVTLPLLAAIAAAAICMRVPPSALQAGAPAFGVFGVTMASLYFLAFASLAGTTPGEWLAGQPSGAPGAAGSGHRLRERALTLAFADARLIAALGAETARRFARRHESMAAGRA
jgi:hypothetical protein